MERDFFTRLAWLSSVPKGRRCSLEFRKAFHRKGCTQGTVVMFRAEKISLECYKCTEIGGIYTVICLETKIGQDIFLLLILKFRYSRYGLPDSLVV